VNVILGLEDSVADTVNVRLEDTLTDTLVLELGDGELEITDPAPTETNAIYVDCDHTPLVGSELPTM
jgi:hypothetical protein